LRTTSLARHAPLASLILVTRLASDLDELFARYDGPAVTLGRMLGSADLLCQVSDLCYPERCYYHLYPELVLAGCDRLRDATGREQLLYGNAFELLRNTPRFYEQVVRKRLDHHFQHLDRCLASHFGGSDPYEVAIRANLDRVARLIAEERVELLDRDPVTTTRDLADVYTQRSRAPS
jgi:hypothetical protein